MIDITELEKSLLTKESELQQKIEKIEAEIDDIDFKIKILSYFKDQPRNEAVRNVTVRFEDLYGYKDEVLEWFKSLGFEINHTFEDVGDGNQTEVFYISYKYNSDKE